ncbi:hypothetical protein A3843_09110 [Pseudovibrio exalbescens]|uniref:Uncharacterized protein n=1 Tax=Pseudovibrio exalbescens TaxID=197461 RepID=A0A1U7JIQ4_9HYPH|nr:hypothetical protein A3843_09110 [Pseudovibrio exalbescens]
MVSFRKPRDASAAPIGCLNANAWITAARQHADVKRGFWVMSIKAVHWGALLKMVTNRLSQPAAKKRLDQIADIYFLCRSETRSHSAAQARAAFEKARYFKWTDRIAGPLVTTGRGASYPG